MITDIREQYNQLFASTRYQELLDSIAERFNHRPPFKIAETPVFVPRALKDKLFQACEEITDVICRPDFKERSKGAILAGQVVPNEDEHTIFLQMDFGICRDENGELTPQLIEVQGFPSLYFFQDHLAAAYRKYFDIPDNYTHLFNGLTPETYLDLLKRTIVGDSNPENVILLEVEPEKQATYIDFVCGEALLGVKTKCVSELMVEGKDLYYLNEQGRKVGVEKIVNRVIFDELIKRDDIKRNFYFTKEANVKWVGHPHWFFRISKHTLPLLDSQYVPKSIFLNDLEEIPEDLHNYVLKPLYSFAGTGVVINLNRFDIEAITDKENYILQRKVSYAPIIKTPDQFAKCELRMLMLWEPGADRPKMVNNLARISKGEMIGVRYNKGKNWVGGSVGFFEQ
ncbi:MAG: hypothetical protein AAGG75_19285 [Bacteroidota bacterium]